MKNRLFAPVLFFFLFAFTGSVIAQQSSYMRTIGGSKSENSYGIEITPDNGYISVGYTESAGAGKKDVYLVKTNGVGTVEWDKTYGGTGNDVGWAVAVAPDSGFVIVGTTDGGGNQDGLMFKTDSDGKVEWTFGFGSDSAEDIYNVVNAKRGGFLITGYVKTDTMGDDGFVAKISDAGKLLWYQRFGSPGNEEAYGIAEEFDGHIVVCGMTNYDSITNGGLGSSKGTTDAILARFKADGTVRWVRTFGTTENDIAWDVKMSSGNYIVNGWSKTSAGDDDVFVFEADTNGSVSWASQYGTFGDDKSFNVRVGANSTYNIAGYTNPGGVDRDVFFLKLNNKGVLSSFTTYGGFGTDGHWPTDLTRDKDGGFMILSTSNSFNKDGDDDFVLIKSEGNGSIKCNSRFELFNTNSVTLASKLFGHSDATYTGSVPKVSTNNITISDSTLCCKLEAYTAGANIKLCRGSSASIGFDAISGYKYKWTDGSGTQFSTDNNPTVSPTKTTTYKLLVTSDDARCSSDSALVKVEVSDPVKFDFARDTAFCSGDAVVYSAFGGISSYTWTGSNLSSNDSSFTLTMADTIYFSGVGFNGCTYQDTMEVMLYDLPEFNLGADTTICTNDYLTLSGPANMVSYNWNIGEATTQKFTTNKEKTHSLVVVDSNGCSFSDEIKILTQPHSTFSLGNDTSFCENSTFLILGPGALSDYIWNDTSSTLQNLPVQEAGTYHLTAFNSFGCDWADTITLTQLPAPNFDLGPDTGFCEGTSYWLVAPAGMKGYQWYNGSINDSLEVTGPGLFYGQVTDSMNCITTDSIRMVEFDNPEVDLGNDTTICDTASLMLDAGMGFAEYKWTTGANSMTITVSDEGDYGVTVTDDKGCEGSDEIRVDTISCQSGSIAELGFDALKYYPSPASSHVNIELQTNFSDIIQIDLADINGRVLKSDDHFVRTGMNTIQLDLNDYSHGIYFVRLSNSRGSTTFRIVVE